MKSSSLSFISLSLFFWLAVSIGCKPEPETCNGRLTFKADCWSKDKNDKNQRPTKAYTDYVCGEVIFTYSDTSDPDWVKKTQNYLAKKGFSKVDSCPCTTKMELWRLDPSKDATQVNLIGVIGGGNDKGKEVGGDGLSLNFTLEFDTSNYQDVNDDSLVYDSVVEDPSKPKVLVATIDSGVDHFSNYLMRNLANPASGTVCLPWKDTSFGLNVVKPTENPAELPMDLRAHGTMVNGVLMGMGLQAHTPPDEITGTQLQLLNVKFTPDHESSGSVFHAVCGMYYAMDCGAKILNLSWGFLHRDQPVIMINALEQAQNKDVVIVAGFGNDSSNLVSGGLRFWPASFAENWDNVISVAALDANGNQLAIFSNRAKSPLLTLAAPGTDIFSADLTDNGTVPKAVAQNSGTSFAAPYVSRAVALMLGKRSGTPKEIRDSLIKNSISVTSGAGAPYLKLNRSQAVKNW